MSVLDELTAAVAAHYDSLIALRARILEVVEPIPIGVMLVDEAGEVGKIVRLCTGASQWSNRTWEVTITGWGLISPDGKLVCEDLKKSYCDGSNIHHRSTEPTCLYTGRSQDNDRGGYCDEVHLLPGPATRALATRLPAAIECYMAECISEAEANSQTLSGVAA